MKINLLYNEITKSIEIDIKKKIGTILEEILNSLFLMIYNIEKCELIINKNTYNFGSDDMLFSLTFEDFLKNLDKSEDSFKNLNKSEDSYLDKSEDSFKNLDKSEDSLKNLDKSEDSFKNLDKSEDVHYSIVLYDRLRDNNGNVIKDNITIENYNKWYTNNESENFIEYGDNRHIIRFPLNTVLNNIFNTSNLNQEEEEYDNMPINNINNIINIFDRYLQNNQNNIFNIIEEDLVNPEINEIPEFIPFSDINNIFYSINNSLDNSLHEDVKIIISEENFDKLENITYEDLNLSELTECQVCTEEFNKEDEIKKLICNHIFHKNCIKQWLCEESNKCPVCRVEVEEGIHK
jgi:hypothetical protein